MTSTLFSLPITTARHLLRRRLPFTAFSTTATTTAHSHGNVIDVLESRGLIESTTSLSLRTAATTPLKVYYSLDITAGFLHLDNLLAITVLSWFHRYGHHPIALIKGATSRVGHPSRNAYDIADITKKLKKISSGSLVILNNYEKGIKAGYDFVHLFKNEGVRVQIGGSDEWGNITAETDLIRKVNDDDNESDVYGLTFPLLLKSDGTKFGQSKDGAIWYSSYKWRYEHTLYDYLFRVPDEDVIRFLKMLTFLELDEIDEIEKGMGRAMNSAQKRLAEEVTRFVHGQGGLDSALRSRKKIKQRAVLFRFRKNHFYSFYV